MQGEDVQMGSADEDDEIARAIAMSMSQVFELGSPWVPVSNYIW